MYLNIHWDQICSHFETRVKNRLCSLIAQVLGRRLVLFSKLYGEELTVKKTRRKAGQEELERCLGEGIRFGDL